jgi:hypothetical protein
MSQLIQSPRHDQAPDPLRLIGLAMRSHPAFKFALFVGGLLSVATIVKAGITSPTEALAWGFIMVILMMLAVCFVTFTGLRQSVLRSIATFLAWSVAVIFVVSAVFLALSAFANWPTNFAETIDNVVHKSHQAMVGKMRPVTNQPDVRNFDQTEIPTVIPQQSVNSQSARVGDLFINRVHCDRISTGEVHCYLTATNTGTDNLDLIIYANQFRVRGSYIKFSDGTRLAAKEVELGLDKPRGYPYATDKVLAKDDIVATLKFDISSANASEIAELVTVWGYKKDGFGLPIMYDDPAVFRNIPILQK